MKLTEWYDVDTPPVRNGFYDYQYDFMDNYTFNALFQNGEWYIYDEEYPEYDGQPVNVENGHKWRGIAK